MSLVNDILQAQGGGAVKQLAGQLGLSEEQAASAIRTLVPGLAGKVRENAQGGGLAALAGLVTGGVHQKYLDNPAELSQGQAVAEGNDVLGQILGSKDASRQVARQASQQTGIGEDVLKRMLPLVASMVMGAISRRYAGTASPNQPNSMGTGFGGILSSMLDADKDGSVLDDVMGKLGKLM
jgi:hypothetical protein